MTDIVRRIFFAIFFLTIILFAAFIILHHYPPLLVFFYLVSLLLLGGIVVKTFFSQHAISLHRKEILLIAGLLAIAFFVRMYKIEEITPGMYGDEITVAKQSLEMVGKKEWIPFDTTYSHPTPLLYLTAASISTFGHTVTAVRLPSIVFGTLAVGVFYILLRLFFSVPIASAGALLFAFQYTAVVLSRLAYEPPAGLFFEILTLVCFVLYSKTKQSIYALAIALAIGGGLYTYLSFRPFALLIFIVTLVIIAKEKTKHKGQKMLVFCLAVFISTMPLLSVMVDDPVGFWGRANEISIFSRHYSTTEFFKELGGNIYRTGSIPFIGDPNPGKNPAGAPLYDPLTILLVIGGIVFLFRKQRKMFYFILLLLIPPFVSDIFSTEVIPEFHYYGLGHPNALRVSGMIPLVLFIATYGFAAIYNHGKKMNVQLTNICLVVLTLGICLWNYLLYFNQKEINAFNYVYNYTYNHAEIEQLATYLQPAMNKTVGIDTNLATVSFFLNPTISLSEFTATSSQSAETELGKHDITAFKVTPENQVLLSQLVTRYDTPGSSYAVQLITNPLGEANVVLVSHLK